MATFQYIQSKLEQFIRKYYTNELIKGLLLFVAIGLLYFLITLLIEHYLWLSPRGRTGLFWAFVLVEAGLFFRLIAFPLAKLFKLQKGIDHARASRIIGDHFPEVGDKLLNVLQLSQNPQQSELLLAGIEQKSAELQPVPFQKAVNFKKSLRYARYAALPVGIYLLFALTGHGDVFSGSYNRVVNYNTAYEPPAPFSFFVLNDSLRAVEGKPFTLRVHTTGDVVPQNASIRFNGESYYLQQTAPGVFHYTFSQPATTTEFRLQANAVTSKPYRLEVLPVPALLSFEMELDYPRYTGKRPEILKSTGNAVIPEGTRVRWNMQTKQTDVIQLKTADSTYRFEKDGSNFSLQQSIRNKWDYAISTSNAQLADYENLAFTLRVVKDQYPEINVEARQDSLNTQITYLRGRLTDDYGLTKLRLIYYPDNDESAKKVEELPVNKATFDEFLYVFPGNLPLEEGITYTYYFEVFDNDGVNGSKSSRSTTYAYRKLSRDEEQQQQLQQQRETIQDLDESLRRFEEQKKALDELTQSQRQKKELNWNDKQKLEEFIKRQQQQEEMMKKFSDKLKNNLEESGDDQQKDPFKEQLQERIEENEQKAKENERLLEELDKLREKIQQEELLDKLEKIEQQNKSQQRNLEQLLELTKRYYVEKKAQKLAEDLKKLAEEQENLANSPKEENTSEKQDTLNEKFEEYREEMKELQQENQKLQKPMQIPDQSFDEDAVQQEQQEASDKLEQDNQEGAQENQQKAADKMKQMGQQMQMQMMGGGQKGMQEDAAMLRQILENLVVFSHSQEDLMQDFRELSYRHPNLGRKLVYQNTLKQNFQHVDDSLFALALRNPMIGSRVNDLIAEAHYNMDKSLENFSDNKFPRGLANQQYTVTAANDLAVLLESALNNMQMQMSAAGQGEGGEGEGFQLPDIIQMQESLNQQMEDGMQEGNQDGDQGEGGGQDGEQGDGSQGGEGGEGQQGNESGQGQDGGQDGENGNQPGTESDKLGDGEQMSGQLYEIYMKQQLLRMQLEDKLRQEGLLREAENLIRKMEEVEQELLEKGFDRNTLNKMNNLKHELLKLEKAAHQQGEKEERKGRTNQEEFDNRQTQLLENARQYFNTVEILNRQALPLRQIYQQKVQQYFQSEDD